MDIKKVNDCPTNLCMVLRGTHAAPQRVSPARAGLCSRCAVVVMQALITAMGSQWEKALEVRRHLEPNTLCQGLVPLQ